MKLVAGLGLLAVVAVGCRQQHAEVVDLGGPGVPPLFDGGIPSRPSGPPPSFGPTVTASKPPAPLSGGTLRVLADGKTAVAADPDRDQLSIVDLVGNTVKATIALAAGDEPGRSVEDAAGRVHVVARGGGALYTIDPALAAVTARRPVCAAPRGLAYEASGDRLHVACAGGELVTLPAAGGAAVRTVQLERDLRDVVVVGGQLWVSTFRTAAIITVAADGSVAARQTLPMSHDFSGQSFAPSVAWRMMALPGGKVGVIHQRAVVGPVQVTPGGYGGDGTGGCGGIVQGAVTLLDGTQSPPGRGLAAVVLPADFDYAPQSGQLAVLSAGNGHTPMLGSVVVTPLAALGAGGAPDMGPVKDPGGCVNGVRPGVAGEAIALAFDGAGHLWMQTR